MATTSNTTIESLEHGMHYTKLIIKGFEKRIERNLNEIESFKDSIKRYKKQLRECKKLIMEHKNEQTKS